MSLPVPLAGNAALGVWIVGDIFVAMLVLLALRQLRPHRLRGTLWLPVAFYLYVVGTALFQIVETAGPGLPSSPVSDGELLGGFLLAAGVGAGLGRWAGGHVKLMKDPRDGQMLFIGGPRVVGLEIAFLLPWFVRQFVYLVETLGAGGGSVVVEAAASPLLYFELLAGALLLVAACVAVLWRTTVLRRARERTASAPRPAA